MEAGAEGIPVPSLEALEAVDVVDPSSPAGSPLPDITMVASTFSRSDVTRPAPDVAAVAVEYVPEPAPRLDLLAPSVLPELAHAVCPQLTQKSAGTKIQPPRLRSADAVKVALVQERCFVLRDRGLSIHRHGVVHFRFSCKSASCPESVPCGPGAPDAFLCLQRVRGCGMHLGHLRRRLYFRLNADAPGAAASTLGTPALMLPECSAGDPRREAEGTIRHAIELSHEGAVESRQLACLLFMRLVDDLSCARGRDVELQTQACSDAVEAMLDLACALDFDTALCAVSALSDLSDPAMVNHAVRESIKRATLCSSSLARALQHGVAGARPIESHALRRQQAILLAHCCSPSGAAGTEGNDDGCAGGNASSSSATTTTVVGKDLTGAPIVASMPSSLATASLPSSQQLTALASSVRKAAAPVLSDCPHDVLLARAVAVLDSALSASPEPTGAATAASAAFT